jgi:hypothetical protein
MIRNERGFASLTSSVATSKLTVGNVVHELERGDGFASPCAFATMLRILIDCLLLGANWPRGVHKISQIGLDNLGVDE